MTLYQLVATSLAGFGPPTDDIGTDGAIYLDLASGRYHGPKANGSWPPAGAGISVPVLTDAPVLDVGTSGQIRAGRQLTGADFAALGLNAPLGLWNLSNLTDASGNGRALANKNAVTFAAGINGTASSAAQFRGASGTPANDPALYIPDDASGTLPGAAFRIKTGSWGCWFRTAQRGTYQSPLGKWPAAAGQYAWLFQTDGGSNALNLVISSTGSDVGVLGGASDVCDDRWHFGVATVDGTRARLYIDGVLDAATAWAGPLFAGNAPLNIGGFAADAGNPVALPHYGRVDEAFVTADVLSEEHVRYLYAAKLAHTLAAVPASVSLAVARRVRGVALPASPKTAAEHIEAWDATALYIVLDTLASDWRVNIKASA